MALNEKILEHFEGAVVRKDLTKLVKGNAVVPTYVLEYLLGQHCASGDEEIVRTGVQKVKDIIKNHFVYRDEAEVIKSLIKEKGQHRIIDKVSVKLNENSRAYEAQFSSLGLRRVPVSSELIKQHQKLLSHGVWCIVTLGFEQDDDVKSPWVIESLKPIQISSVDLESYKNFRKEFTKEEWVDLIMQSIGLNPEEFTFRSKLLQLMRLVPFVENNYNLIELGPKGTGKSHIYSELSPHGILISGGEVSKAKLFVNNSNGDIGLVGYWDVVAYDEFAGKTKRTDRGLVDIMKNYMANKSFSRGTEVYGASASMAFVGNTDHSVPYMLKHSNLFDALPKDYYDSAFLDRLHAYIPGWEIQKLRNEMFTSDYGFIVDYLAEILRVLRREDQTQAYRRFFDLSDSITTRDKTSIAKTFAGLAKVIYPHGEFSEAEAKELLDLAIECRKRVKQQLQKMDETFEEVDFSYVIKSSGKRETIETLEVVEYMQAVSGTPASTARGGTSVSKTVDQREDPLQLEEKQIIIRDNQTGISYEKLFGDYLVGATEIVLVDPYIRLPYQMRNLMEFIKLVVERKAQDAEVKLKLTTTAEEEYRQQAEEAFSSMVESTEGMGVLFEYEFDDFIHDRHIILNNGWKIILGRGLDLWQKTGGWYDINEYLQEKRVCKSCEVTFLKNN